MLNVKIERGHVEKLVVGKLKSADGKNFLVLDSLDNELLKLDLSGAVDKFDDDDIISVSPEGLVTLLYKSKWQDLTLFFTNDCNSRCIMCPQISDEDRGNYLEFNKNILDLKPENLAQIGITGGEPTIYKNDLVELLEYIHESYADIPILLLTNGRNFSDIDFVKNILSAGHRKILTCIPIYAATSNQHDEIVGVKNAFSQTSRGIYNLYRFSLPIEIRIVIFRKNYQWLSEFANFIWRNFPFVAHVAFMGMEYTGNADLNKKEFWIEPYQFRDELDEATAFLHQRNISVSIYNIPLCLLNERSRIFSRDSISAWKKKFFDNCKECSQQEFCSGDFATSTVRSDFINPIRRSF